MRFSTLFSHSEAGGKIVAPANRLQVRVIHQRQSDPRMITLHPRFPDRREIPEEVEFDGFAR